MNVLKNKACMESLGLFLLLVSFGWQCLADRLNQTKTEGYIYEMNQKLDALWSGIYDEALHSERYIGQASVSVNYDVLNQSFSGWGEAQKEFKMLNHQSSFATWFRVVLYFIGSFCILFAKLPESTRKV